ncbi:NADH dehydrogenase subunit 4 (mitochondrion) [Diaphorina citri]|uniref:NADH-ubiquinone oxidoreductase chain 4 n=2 Tax=Diaphorina citri TaxID=121845 RepID=A0A1X9QH13_DIACI|nr:NADH dehydrogenase subunit 4 [Diaphorina citri]ANC65508.1 NADH dehydrogenase subunit 4 [Diaphorina citri]AOW71072.1 NADH dehydrogenase subunit 4 [Diaphorina citri]ARQ27120.1 NADH dehydrogenase subunit 4 [Diaphorina citri]ARQ27133.1 NADH dehydrogenase subunit 4 [Diaphorina citri]ATD85659.1 NADH dehydrogenase subunit 4 [Diaphorina citri]
MLEVGLGFLGLFVVMSWDLVVGSLVFFILFLLLNMMESGEMTIKLIFVLLSLWLVIMMVLSVEKFSSSLDLYLIFIFMLISLFIVFYSEALVSFYLGFEMSVIPIFLIILGWGYQPDRVEAGVYMIIYTVFFSLPLLMGIYYFNMGHELSGMPLVFMFLLAFLVKFPLVGLHLWLPRAHVEAPVYGSMILAGVMLKLGGYGIIKLSFIMGDFLYKYSSGILIFSILGGLILTGVCFVQTDMKMLIAYSSIVHMSVVLSGILTMKISGLIGSVYLMVGHGLCSSGLFCVLGLVYNRSLTRSLYLNKGMINIIPISSLWWFLFCSSNLAFPPCLNLPGEIFLFISVLGWNWHFFLVVGLLGVLSSMYSIYLFSFSQQGKMSFYFSFKSFNLYECMLLSLHWIPLNLFILDLSIMTF